MWKRIILLLLLVGCTDNITFAEIMACYNFCEDKGGIDHLDEKWACLGWRCSCNNLTAICIVEKLGSPEIK